MNQIVSEIGEALAAILSGTAVLSVFAAVLHYATSF